MKRGILLITTAKTVAPLEWRNALWDVYSSRLGEIQLKSPFRQYMERDEFVVCMDDETFIKVVLLDDSLPVGILLLARDISRVAWLHAAFFQARYAEMYEAGQLFYYAGIAVKRGVSTRGVVLMHHRMLEEFFRLDGKMLFHDYAGSVHASFGSLGALLARKHGGKATEIDQMHFWGLEAPEAISSEFGFQDSDAARAARSDRIGSIPEARESTKLAPASKQNSAGLS